jgi:hypothetical protein
MKKTDPIAKIKPGMTVGFFYTNYGKGFFPVESRPSLDEVEPRTVCKEVTGLQPLFDEQWKKAMRWCENHTVVSVSSSGARMGTGISRCTYYTVVLRDPRGETFTSLHDATLRNFRYYLYPMELRVIE